MSPNHSIFGGLVAALSFGILLNLGALIFSLHILTRGAWQHCMIDISFDDCLLLTSRSILGRR